MKIIIIFFILLTLLYCENKNKKKLLFIYKNLISENNPVKNILLENNENLEIKIKFSNIKDSGIFKFNSENYNITEDSELILSKNKNTEYSLNFESKQKCSADSNYSGILTDSISINFLCNEFSYLDSYLGPYCVFDSECSTGNSDYINSDSYSARFDSPKQIVYDNNSGYFLISDKNNHRIRKYKNGITEDLSGNGIPDSIDGYGINASLHSPEYIISEKGYIYLADKHSNSIRRITVTDGNTVILITSNSLLKEPRGMSIYGNKLYILEKNDKNLLELDLNTLNLAVKNSSGINSPRNMIKINDIFYFNDSDYVKYFSVNDFIIKILTGKSYSGFKNGILSEAELDSPYGITTDGINIFISESNNNSVRKIDIINNTVSSVIAGNTSGFKNSYLDSALTDSPLGIFYLNKIIYLIDKNNTIRIIK